MIALALLAFGWGAPRATAASLNTADYVVENWGLEEGLPQVSVTSIAQTGDGYLWLGTFNGLARFDGRRFVVVDEGNTPALGSSRITDLTVDDEGTLWVVTEAGGLVRRRDGRFQTCVPPPGLPPSGALAMVRDAAGRLLLVDGEQRLRLVKPGEFPLLAPGDPLPAPEASSLLRGSGGQAWLWDGGKAVHASQRPVPLAVAEAAGETNASVRIACLAPRRAGGYWLATSHRVQRFEAGRLRPPVWPLPTATPELRFLVEDRDGSLWLGDAMGGVHRLGADGSSHAFGVGNGLADKHVSALFCDREGSVWVGTGQGGLHRFRPRLIRMYEVPGAGASQVVTSVTEDRQGQLWVGVNGAGLHRRDGASLVAVTEPAELARYGLVYSVLAGHDNALWVGLYGRTVLEVRDGGVRPHLLEQSLLRTTPWALFEGRDRAIWLGTDRGLQRHRAGRFDRYTRAEGLSDDRVQALAEDAQGTLFVGTSGGLSCLRDGAFTVYTERDGLPDNHITALYVDRADQVWLGTASRGLVRFRAGQFQRVPPPPGMPSGSITSVIEDEAGGLWLGSNRGLLRLPRPGLEAWLEGRESAPAWQVFGRSDGLNSIGCGSGAQPASCRSRDGRLWFGTVRGLAVVDPRALAPNPLPPPVVIEEVRLDDQVLVAADWTPPAAGAPELSPGGGVLRVQPGVQRVEFHFTGLSLAAPEKVRFRYRLDGYDRSWIEAGAQRTAPYTRIPPGAYRFHVVACNNDGVWSPAGATLAVDFRPAWWQAWWFRGALVATLTGGLLWAGGARWRRLKRDQAVQRGFSRRLLELQEGERKRIAGELHDGLGQDLLVIKNRALLGLQEPGLNPGPADHLEEISRLASHTLEEIREISRNLRPYQLDRLGLTRALRAMITGVSQATHLPIRAELDPLEGLLPPSLEIHLYRIVQELLNNVVRHSHASLARVTASHQAARLTLTVEDDGCGFDPEAQARTTAPRGLGLTDLAERVQLLGGTARCLSRPAAGARWTIDLPVNPTRPA